MSKMPSMLSIAVIMTSASISIVIIGSLFVPGFTFGFDPLTGSFGYLTYGNPVYAFFALGLIAGAMTFGLIAYSLSVFSSLIICTA